MKEMYSISASKKTRQTFLGWILGNFFVYLESQNTLKFTELQHPMWNERFLIKPSLFLSPRSSINESWDTSRNFKVSLWLRKVLCATTSCKNFSSIFFALLKSEAILWKISFRWSLGLKLELVVCGDNVVMWSWGAEKTIEFVVNAADAATCFILSLVLNRA